MRVDGEFDMRGVFRRPADVSGVVWPHKVKRVGITPDKDTIYGIGTLLEDATGCNGREPTG